MKTLFVILDGIGDLPCSKLQGKTPLEAANTPNLDWFATNSELGYCYAVKEGIVPESDSSVISLFGNEPFLSGTRGQLEALGAGIKLQRGDLALRTNFATIDNLKNKVIKDRRAGRTLTTKEAYILTKSINKQLKLPCRFVFKNTVQHRGVLVLRGGFSDNITNTDTAYDRLAKRENQGKNKLIYSKPFDETENAKYSSDLINSFTDQSYKILANHPVNIKRIKGGLLPANIILSRDAGSDFVKLKKLHNWMAVSYMPLEIGIAKTIGMDVYTFSYPALKTKDIYQALRAGLTKAIKVSKKTLWWKVNKYDYAYLHFKEFDLPGHDNNPKQRVSMIEELDKDFFSFIKNLCIKYKVRLVLTADHSTPCEKKAHSEDPVPFLVFNPENKKNEKKRFTEKDCRKGKLGKLFGKEVLEKFII